MSLGKKGGIFWKYLPLTMKKTKATVCLIEFWEIDLICLNLLIQYDGKIKALSVRFCLAFSLCVPWHTSIISSNSYLSLLSGSDGERWMWAFNWFCGTLCIMRMSLQKPGAWILISEGWMFRWVELCQLNCKNNWLRILFIIKMWVN